MQFTVEFYEAAAGHCPIREFLDDLKKSNPDDFAAVVAGLAKLRDKRHHRPPLSKAVGNELFELRHLGKLNTRVLYFFTIGRRIVTVHGIRNKSRAIPIRDRKIAIERKDDWMRRNRHEKGNEFRPLSQRTVAGPGF